MKSDAHFLHSYADQVDASIFSSPITEPEAALRHFLIEEARGKLQKAKECVKSELNAILDQFERVHRNDQTLLFDNWLTSRAGDDYREALLEKDKASSVLKNLEGTQQEDLARVRDILDSARTVDSFKEGNNMPCALRDVDIDRTIEGSQSAPQPGVVFRPSYFMSGYWNTSERWVRENATASPTVRTLVIDPLESKRLKWGDFGFPELDTTSPSRKADLAKIVGNGRMTLKCARIAAFDVFRGIWNIDGFRTVLPPLTKDAPKELGQKICKTTKLLLAYDVEVVLELEKTLVSGLGVRNVPVFPDVFGGIPFSIGEEVEGKVVSRAGLPRANAYPVLLAVLADVV